MNEQLNKKDKLVVARFLNTEAGLAMISVIQENAPGVQKSPNAHEMQFDSGKTEGWTQCVKFIKTLATLKTSQQSADEDDSLRDE